MALEIDLCGRVALVTGGSRGLGRQDALVLAQAGADVVIADIQIESDESEDAAEYGALAQVAKAQGLVYSEQTAQEIQELGRRSAAIKCDVTDREQVAATVARVVEELGSVDILVNNAAHARPRRAAGRPGPRPLGARSPRQPHRSFQLLARRSGRTWSSAVGGGS